MDVAALSMNIGAVSAGIKAQTAVLKMAMDIPGQAVDKLLNGLLALEEDMAGLIVSNLGQNIDIYV